MTAELASGDSPLRERVAEEIRAVMGRRRMSGSRVAKAMGRSDMYLSRRLNGQTPLDMDDLEKLAEVLDVPVSVFFAGQVLASSSSESRREGITNVDKCTPVTLTASLTSRCVTRGIDAPLELAA